MPNFGKYSLSTFLLPLVFLALALTVMQNYGPYGLAPITYTYMALYNTMQSCFPSVAGLAFAVVIGIPHALFAALLYYVLLRFFHRFPVNVYAVQWTIKSIQLYLTLALKLRLFTKSGGYKTNAFKQFIVSAFIVSIFTGLYYLLKGQGEETSAFFHRQLRLSHVLIAVLMYQLFTVVYICRDDIIPFIKNLLKQSGSPYTLAIVRIVILNRLYHQIDSNYSQAAYWAGFPDDMRVSLPYMGWFIHNIPISPSLYKTLAVAASITSVMGVVGFFSRPAIFISAILSIYVIGVPFFYGKLMHMHIWVWFPLILAFSRCGDVLSVDFLINKYLLKKEVNTARHPQYNLPLLFIWLHLGIIYFFAGIVKLDQCGLQWALGSSMINQIQVEWIQHYNQIPAIRIDNYPTLLHIGGIGVILFELYFFFLILSPIGRIIAFIGGLSMHNIINYFMYIGFQDLQRTYVALIDWAGVKKLFKPAPQVPATFPLKTLLQQSSYKLVLAAGLFLFSINFIFGLLRIHSWPFSSYPTYSTIVPDSHTYIYFAAYDSMLQKVDVYKAGKEAGFRMESFTPIEDRISENLRGNDTAMLRINTAKLWKIWVANVPELERVDSVTMYLRNSPVAPDKAHTILKETYLVSYSF